MSRKERCWAAMVAMWSIGRYEAYWHYQDLWDSKYRYEL